MPRGHRQRETPRQPVASEGVDEAYKDPVAVRSLELASRVQGTLSALCQAASSHSSGQTLQQSVKQACSFLQQLNTFWLKHITKGGVKYATAFYDKDRILPLFDLNHACLPDLLAAHALALRASAPDSTSPLHSCMQEVFHGPTCLLRELQLSVRAVINAEPPVFPYGIRPTVDERTLRMLRTRKAVVMAFLRTQPLRAAAAVLHAHRQRLAEYRGDPGACRGDPAAQLDALCSAAEAWVLMVDLACLVRDARSFLINLLPRDAEADALSHAMAHLCALRLDLAEGLARVQEQLGKDVVDARLRGRLRRPMEEEDRALLILMGKTVDARVLGGMTQIHVDRLAVSLATCRQGGPDADSCPELSHPAVQFLLGWWMVAPGAVAEGPDRCAWGLPEGLLSRVPDMQDQSQLCMYALMAAGPYWEHVMLAGLDLPPQQHGGLAPAVAASAAAGEVAAARAGALSDGAGGAARGAGPAAASPGSTPADVAPAVAVDAPVPAGESSPAAAGSMPTVPQPDKLIFNPVQAYRLCTAAVRHCCSAAESAPQGMPVGIRLNLGDALEHGMSSAVACLLRMTPTQAARHLATAWQLLLRSIKHQYNDGMDKEEWHVAQLLGEVAQHVQQAEGRRGGLSAAEEAVVPVAADPDVAGGSQETHGSVASDDESQDAAGPAGQASHGGAAGGRAPLAVSCALAAGLLPELEARLRRCCSAEGGDEDSLEEFQSAARLVDLTLRRPGCWPALLAHGDQRQAAALVVSLGKAARAETAAEWRAGAQAGRRVRETSSLLHLQLLALLEQLGPRSTGRVGKRHGKGDGEGHSVEGHGGDDGAGGSEAGRMAAAGSGSSTSGGEGQRHAGWPDLRLNRGVGGVEEEGVEGAGSGAEDGGSSTGDGWEAGTTSSNWGELGAAKTPAWAAGPTWQQVENAGGCPAPGTPEEEQLVRLTALAAVEWLPVLLTRNWWMPPSAGLGLEAAPLSDLLPHGAHRVAWAWLRLVARQALGHPADGTRCHAGWTTFLLTRLAALDQVQHVIALALSGDVLPLMMVQSPAQTRMMEAAPELVPAACDLLEVLALAAPEQLRAWLMGNFGPAKLIVMPWKQLVLMELAGKPERAALACVIRALTAPEWPGTGGAGGAGLGGPVWGALRGVVAQRVEREGLPLLPGPDVDLGLQRCAYVWCGRLEGQSEVGVRLRACGRCRVVGYCSAECQRADWAAGHKAACGRAAAEGGQ